MNPDLTSIVNALNRLTAAQQKSIWDYASTVLVGLTLIVLVWYTLETFKLRKAAQQQNEIAVMPMFAVYVDLTGKEALFVLRNVGLGPALNVKITTPELENKNVNVLFGNQVIVAGESQNLRIMVHEGTGQNLLNNNDLYHWINTEKLPEPFNISVHCLSLHLTSYTFVFGCIADAETKRLKITYDDHTKVNPRL